MPIEFLELQQLSKKARETSNDLRKELGEMPHKISGNFIAFFGRQFNPNHKWNCALKPLWSGFYIKYNELEMMVDPGINVLERAERIGINLALTNTLFVSHGHIDHGHDANVIAEMASYRENSYLKILMSEHTYEEKVMSHYHSHHQSNSELILLDNKQELVIGKKMTLKPVEVMHSIKGSYGFILDLNGLRIGYTADTGFHTTYITIEGKELSCFEKDIDKEDIEGPGIFNTNLKKIFSDVDLLVFNLHDVEYRKKTKHNFYHSTVPDVVEVLDSSKVKHCFLEHFNPMGGGLGAAYPKKVCEYIRESTHKDIAMIDLDGNVFNLETL